MATIPSNTQDAVLAVLRSVKEAGLHSVTRTVLFKFVYLLDCSFAQSHQGATKSGVHWYFHHYGPYAADLADSIDEMARIGLIQAAPGEYKDKEFMTYFIGEYPRGPSLKDVGVSNGMAGMLEMQFRRFARDLPKLLDYTYFSTEPMRDATPGHALDFSGLGIEAPTLHKRARITDHAQLLRIATLANKLRQDAQLDNNTAALNAHRPINDGILSDALTAFDRDGVIEPLPFSARLS